MSPEGYFFGINSCAANLGGITCDEKRMANSSYCPIHDELFSKQGGD